MKKKFSRAKRTIHNQNKPFNRKKYGPTWDHIRYELKKGEAIFPEDNQDGGLDDALRIYALCARRAHGDAPGECAWRNTVRLGPVSYTHLTLPTKA